MNKIHNLTERENMKFSHMHVRLCVRIIINYQKIVKNGSSGFPRNHFNPLIFPLLVFVTSSPNKNKFRSQLYRNHINSMSLSDSS